MAEKLYLEYDIQNQKKIYSVNLRKRDSSPRYAMSEDPYLPNLVNVEIVDGFLRIEDHKDYYGSSSAELVIEFYGGVAE